MADAYPFVCAPVLDDYATQCFFALQWLVLLLSTIRKREYIDKNFNGERCSLAHFLC